MLSDAASTLVAGTQVGGLGPKSSDLCSEPEICSGANEHCFMIVVTPAKYCPQGFNSRSPELEIFTRLFSEITVKQKG